MTIKQAAWTGMVPVDDTALAVTDTGGTGTPVVYLNGSYASQKDWRRVIADLGDAYRHITFDERARGKSETATDYSFEACLRDIDAVLAARGVTRPILVGWSYGGLVAMHWAAHNPARIQAVVSVDGALPTEMPGDAFEEQVRKLFRRLSPLFPVLRPLGLAARMSAAQHAQINIELIELCAPAALNPVFGQITTPVRYVLGTGGNLGGDAKVMEQLRADLTPVFARYPNIDVSAKVPSSHSKILRNDYRAVAGAVREIAASDHPVS